MKTGRKFLILDSDETRRQSLAASLSAGTECEIAEAGVVHEGLELLERTSVDAVLLEASLPYGGGAGACRLLRRRGISIPIVVLGDGADAEVVLTLEAGANDYISRPIRDGVLRARLRAHLRQHERSDNLIIALHGFIFWPAARLLVDARSGKKIHLSATETGILKNLCRASGRLVLRETILREVWGDDAGVSEHTIETHIYRLRRKVEPNPRRPERLISEVGGYRLAPPLPSRRAGLGCSCFELGPAAAASARL